MLLSVVAAAADDDYRPRGQRALVIAPDSPGDDADDGAAVARTMMPASSGAAGEEEEEEEEAAGEGCWASYGRRHDPRRLPPPLPSLVASRLARARTPDGRLVISRQAAARRVVRGRKADGRLVLGLVADNDDAAPRRRRRRWSHPLAAREASSRPAIDDEEPGVHVHVLVPEEGIRLPASSSPVASACSDGTARVVSLGGIIMPTTSLPRTNGAALLV